MDAEQVWVQSEPYEFVCALTVGGELDLTNAAQFSQQAIKALHGTHGAVLVDLSGLCFADCCGARTLAQVLSTVPPWRAVKVRGYSAPVERVLNLLGIELSRAVPVAAQILGSRRPLPSGRASAQQGQTLAAQARTVQAQSREVAIYASGVMARLATTYAGLAVSSRYRAERRQEDRGRLLVLSQKATELSTRYLDHAVGSAGSPVPRAYENG
jgi:anti-anti-sigma factor